MKGDESLIGTQISYAKPIFVVDRSFPESPEEYRLTRLCNAQGHVSVSMVHSRLSKPTNARNPCIHKDMSQCQRFTLDCQNQPMQGIHACSQKISYMQCFLAQSCLLLISAIFMKMHWFKIPND